MAHSSWGLGMQPWAKTGPGKQKFHFQHNTKLKFSAWIYQATSTTFSRKTLGQANRGTPSFFQDQCNPESKTTKHFLWGGKLSVQTAFHTPLTQTQSSAASRNLYPKGEHTAKNMHFKCSTDAAEGAQTMETWGLLLIWAVERDESMPEEMLMVLHPVPLEHLILKSESKVTVII